MLPYLILIYAVIIISLLVIFYLVKYTFSQDTGTSQMQEISTYIKEGAMAFIKRQYKTISILSILALFLIILCNYIGNSLKRFWHCYIYIFTYRYSIHSRCILFCFIRLYWNVYGSQFKCKSCCWCKKRFK